MAEAYIVAAVRTAGGRRRGRLAGWHPVDLGAKVLDAVVARAGVPGEAMDDVIVGCVTQAGEQALHVGRHCVLASGLPLSVPAVTIDRQCGSSQQAIQFAAQAVMSGTQDIVIAAGTESMTRVPMGSAITLAKAGGIGANPFSGAIQKRYGVEMFSQFQGAQMIADKPPRYPVESRRKREQGTVVLTLTLGLDGAVENLVVTQSSGFSRLDKAASEAVRGWRWKPVLRSGQPVRVRGVVEIPFILRTDAA